MKPDDRICYCFHVSLRKLVNFAKRERSQKASQLSECLGAGTGCGWCIPMLKKIHERVHNEVESAGDSAADWLPQTPAEYERQRKTYLHSDKKNQF